MKSCLILCEIVHQARLVPMAGKIYQDSACLLRAEAGPSEGGMRGHSRRRAVSFMLIGVYVTWAHALVKIQRMISRFVHFITGKFYVQNSNH